MRLTSLLFTTSAAFAVALPQAPNTPPGQVQPGQPTDCNKWVEVTLAAGNCADIAATAGVPLSVFKTWNPSIGADCSNMWGGYYVCTGTASYTPPATLPPGPFQEPFNTGCTAWRQVVADDNCYSLAFALGITDAELRVLNPFIDTGCTNIWLNYWICAAATP